ncbi:hypothetical protein NEDG_00334 [Nematocida displodere]|uniref:Uncharacterized protein n=1 Tax=Nematocida displodere TaxID=1805483 RepID=A0A177ELK4_9MICR|nr:hypothetical protein NEDG_00334 [Nematocida displodere]
MNRATVIGLGIGLGAGLLHPVLNARKKKESSHLLPLGLLGVSTCFFLATRMEYINMLKGKSPGLFSPSGLLYLGGMYSTGAVVSSAALKVCPGKWRGPGSP